jgi:hypothetical protein
MGGSQMNSAEIKASSIEDFFPNLFPAEVEAFLPDLPTASDNEPHFSAPDGQGAALRYVENSAKTVRLTAIKVDYESM